MDKLSYHPSVRFAAVSGRIGTSVEVVDWTGTGTRDLLLSARGASGDGHVSLRRQIGNNLDGTPILDAEETVDGVRGYVTAVPDGNIFHLVSTSPSRNQVYLYPNTGRMGDPEFGEAVLLELNADWVKGNENIHSARFHDIDNDGNLELIVGTGFWEYYWHN
jgi:hypothetical protein